MVAVNATCAGGSRDAKASTHAASPGTQCAEEIVTSRPPGGSIEKAERM